MAELKPCPFCGGEVEETGGSCNFGKKIMTLNVKCRKCGTSVAMKTAWKTNAYIEAVEAWNRIARDISELPAADVAEVVHGQWFVSKIRSIETVFYCSECMRTVTVGNDFFGEAPKSVSAAYPYCHCGAKMDGGNDNVSD